MRWGRYSRKASGESGILPEMVRAACCESDFMIRLLELVHDVWRMGEVVILVLIPKKADLSSCDNWRGFLFWMWLARWLLGYSRRGFRKWQRMSYQSRSVVFEGEKLC